MSTPVLERVVRRETHSPRTVVTVVVLVLLAAGAAYAFVVIVMSLRGLTPLMTARDGALAWLAELPRAQPKAAVVAVAAVAAVLGVVLLWLALSAGRLPRHRLEVAPHAAVADNGVIASAVAERVRHELDLPRDGVLVGVGHRGADVTVRPAHGQRIGQDEARAVAEAELAAYRLSPGVRVRVRVRPRAGAGGVM